METRGELENEMERRMDTKHFRENRVVRQNVTAEHSIPLTGCRKLTVANRKFRKEYKTCPLEYYHKVISRKNSLFRSRIWPLAKSFRILILNLFCLSRTAIDGYSDPAKILAVIEQSILAEGSD